jgi:hypothetical protein
VRTRFFLQGTLEVVMAFRQDGDIGESTLNASLRPVVAAIDHELSRLGEGTVSGVEAAQLRGSWAELVELLALGSAPELRVCPVCEHYGMRAASRCGYCWTSLSPFVEAGGAPEAARIASPELKS